MMPRAGGQYVYLREAFSPLWGFLYGWTLFLVIQTGTIAAVAVGFARFLGVLVPWIADDHYLIAADPPLDRLRASRCRRRSWSASLLIALLTWTNTRGLDYGKLIQNVFTTAKTGALVALIVVGLLLGWNADGGRRPTSATCGRRAAHVEIVPGPDGRDGVRAVRRALRRADRLALLRRRLEQHHVHRRRGEGPAAQHPAVAGARHRSSSSALYLLANVAYLVTLPLDGDPARAGRPRRHGDARRDLPGLGRDDHGGRDHDLDLRLQQRADPGRRARLLRDGARRPVLPARRRR